MVDFDLRQLEYFLEVARLENISAAARTLGVTQPALSRQVRAFEESLGWELLERRKKSVKLTREGLIVQREGQKVVKSLSQSLLRMRNEIEGAEMRVGFAPSLAAGLIEKGMRSFTEKYPRVRVSWFDSSTQEMWEGVESGELDLILEVTTDRPGIQWEKLRQKEFMLMVPRDHEFAKKRWIKPKSLDGERLLLLSRHEYPGYWEQVTRYFAEHKVNAKVAGEFDGISSLRMGVEAGLGVAFVAEGTGVSESVKLLKLKPSPKPLCVALGYAQGRKLAPWENGFLEALRNH